MSEEKKEVMNIHQKLTLARYMLDVAGVKKTGKVEYTSKKTGARISYDFYELHDFLPQTKKIFKDLNMTGICDLRGEKHTDEKYYVKIDIINSYKTDDLVTFYIEKGQAEIQGAQKIQNLAGATSFLKRYLWIIALDITETDIVEVSEKAIFEPGEDEDLPTTYLTVEMYDEIVTSGTKEKIIETLNKYSNAKYNMRKEYRQGLIKRLEVLKSMKPGEVVTPSGVITMNQNMFVDLVNKDDPQEMKAALKKFTGEGFFIPENYKKDLEDSIKMGHGLDPYKDDIFGGKE